MARSRSGDCYECAENACRLPLPVVRTPVLLESEATLWSGAGACTTVGSHASGVLFARPALRGAGPRSSPLQPALRSLVTVRVSQINGCAFCVDINSASVLKRGEDRQKLNALALFRGSELFSEQENAALAYAEAMTFSDQQPDDGHFMALRHCFDDDAIIELTGLIAFQNMSSKFNAALGMEPQGFCQPQEKRNTNGGGV